MKPVPEVHRVADDLFVWHGYNPDCKTDCSSAAVQTPEGFILIDPIRLEEQAIERMVDHDKVAAVLLTSGNHWRGTSYEKERLDIPVYAPEGARDEVQADRWVKDGEILFGKIKAIGLPGGGPGETAYLIPGALILGDALVNLDGLAILPDKYCENPRLLHESVKVLPALEYNIVCFAHGLPMVDGKGRAAIAALVG
jgi:glyoxylase-like metal-dependent hydrolase (beta-lactamase superfamily II)